MGSDWKDKFGDGYTATIGWRDKLIRKSANKIREKAISNAKKRIALKGSNDLNEDEIEVIVGKEEEKLSYKLSLWSRCNNGHAGNLLKCNPPKPSWRGELGRSSLHISWASIALLATMITQTASEFIEYLQVQGTCERMPHL